MQLKNILKKEILTNEQTKRINIFNDVRDKFEFYLPRNIKDCQHTCVQKHELLKNILEQEGYNVNIGAVNFKWSNQTFPPQVKKYLNTANDNEYHFFLKVKIDGEYKYVDCTFENKFVKYNRWNGRDSTKVAVKKGIEVIDYQQVTDIFNEYHTQRSWKDKIETTGEFYTAANKFFDILKKTPGPAKFIFQKAFEYFEK